MFIKSSQEKKRICLHLCISGGSALRGWKSIFMSYLCPVFTASCREGNGNPLQKACLKNSMDRGAWWAGVHGVAQSRT